MLALQTSNLQLGHWNCILTYLPGVILPDLAVTIEQRIQDGHYDNIGEDARDYLTSEHFSITATGERNLCLAHFNEEMTSEEVEAAAAEMEAKELALFEDLLAVGSHPEYRDLQRQFSIISLGSSALVEGHYHVPYLYGWQDEHRWDRSVNQDR